MNLLKLDRWKLFLLISPLPIIILFIILPIIENVLEFFFYANQIFLYIWYYQIGIQLQNSIPPSKVKRFKIAFLITAALFIFSLSNQFYHEYILQEDPFEWMHNESLISVCIRFAIYLLLGSPSMIYIIYFNIKTLSKLKNPTWAYNNVQTTWLILLAPAFGALLLQPRINIYIRRE